MRHVIYSCSRRGLVTSGNIHCYIKLASVFCSSDLPYLSVGITALYFMRTYAQDYDVNIRARLMWTVAWISRSSVRLLCNHWRQLRHKEMTAPR
jgi:hypothetical protein